MDANVINVTLLEVSTQTIQFPLMCLEFVSASPSLVRNSVMKGN